MVTFHILKVLLLIRFFPKRRKPYYVHRESKKGQYYKSQAFPLTK